MERFDLWVSRSLPRLSTRGNRAVYRLSGGRVGGAKRGVPIALLTTTGRRSGRPRTVPVMYLETGGRVLLVASNAGFDAPPAWFFNLLAHPEAEWRTGSERRAMVGRVVDDAERDALWPRLIDHNPLWEAYQSYTDRRLPVVALEEAPDRGS